MHETTPSANPRIHPTAVVDREVELDDGVQIGPYCVLTGRISVGPRTVIHAHSVIQGHALIGADCRIGPAAYVGLDPQHVSFDARTETSVVIGDKVMIREGASVHRATRPGIEYATRIGRGCFLMGASHAGHDCQVGDGVIMANGVLLGGHVHVGERAFFGGGSAVHQFVQIGRLVIVSGNECVTRDVPPFAAVRYSGIKGYNAVGCRRAGLPREAIHAIRQAYQCLHTTRTTPGVVAAIRALASPAPQVQEILDFIASSKRGIQPSVKFLGRILQSDDDDD
jgi:UDP-N-acetylglucosamine acyltransferase